MSRSKAMLEKYRPEGYLTVLEYAQKHGQTRQAVYSASACRGDLPYMRKGGFLFIKDTEGGKK